MDPLEIFGAAWELLAALGAVALHWIRAERKRAADEARHLERLDGYGDRLNDSERELAALRQRQEDFATLGQAVAGLKEHLGSRLDRIERLLDRKVDF